MAGRSQEDDRWPTCEASCASPAIDVTLLEQLTQGGRAGPSQERDQGFIGEWIGSLSLVVEYRPGELPGGLDEIRTR